MKSSRHTSKARATCVGGAPPSARRSLGRDRPDACGLLDLQPHARRLADRDPPDVRGRPNHFQPRRFPRLAHGGVHHAREFDLPGSFDRLAEGDGDPRRAGRIGVVGEFPGFETGGEHVGDFERGGHAKHEAVDRAAVKLQGRRGVPQHFPRGDVQAVPRGREQQAIGGLRRAAIGDAERDVSRAADGKPIRRRLVPFRGPFDRRLVQHEVLSGGKLDFERGGGAGQQAEFGDAVAADRRERGRHFERQRPAAGAIVDEMQPAAGFGDAAEAGRFVAEGRAFDSESAEGKRDGLPAVAEGAEVDFGGDHEPLAVDPGAVRRAGNRDAAGELVFRAAARAGLLVELAEFVAGKEDALRLVFEDEFEGVEGDVELANAVVRTVGRLRKRGGRHGEEEKNGEDEMAGAE
ncbi:MAG: hypothetical protein WD066_17770 [Planctomycetaceae bacterium]